MPAGGFKGHVATDGSLLGKAGCMKKWESEKHKGWGFPAEGFMGHVATDGSWLGKAGKWRARCWAVVQLDHDEEMVPLHGTYGSMERNLRSSAPSRGGAHGLLMPSQERDRTHQGACG